ncbi:MAG TPA: S41 family peptidase [Thermoanaerobaculia bacterium]|nr:S41 family peptidase [Thermoanaerobaculia bacterium]
MLRVARLCFLLFVAPAFAQPADLPPRPLEGRGLDNLAAFTRLLGYVRYFHPSDAAADTNWNAFAIHAVKDVEAAKSPEDLARRLEDLFRPVAPTVQVFPTGKAPELHRALMPPGDNPAIIGWHHLGVEMGSPHSIYRSRRIDDKTPLLDEAANLGQEVVPSLVAGRKIRFRAWLRTEGFGQHGGAGLWTQGWNEDGEEMAMAMKDRPYRGTEWQEVELIGDLEQSVTGFYLGISLWGGGRAWVDNAVLEAARPDGTWEAIPLKNPGFDQEDSVKKGRPANWSWSERQKGYEIALVAGCREGGCAALTGKPVVPPTLAPPAEVFEAELGGGVSCRVPLTLYLDGYLDGKGKTVPASHGWIPPATNGWQPSGNDRATRLADVALAWNVFQHFYPYFDVVQTDWPAALREALTSAATDRDELAFLYTLRALVAQLHDGHGHVALLSQDWQKYAALPLALRWIEDGLTVAAVVPGKADRIRPGDVVLSIGGVPAAEALAKRERLTSGATPQWIRWNAVNRLVRGLIGESARLKIQPAEGEPYEVSLPYEVKFPYPDESRPEKISEIRPGIWYVDTGRIDDGEFLAAVEKLAAAKGVIFDLRGYPGKLSPVVLQYLTATPIISARWNVPIVTRPDRQGMEFHFSNWSLEPREPRIKGKVAFLTDGRAISYAETYMGMVEHYKLAEIVGGPTAGTNGNVNPFELPGGYSFSWTGMKVLKHDGSQHHGIGILPTVPAVPTLKGVREGRDEVLEKGIETVSR